MIPLIDMHCDTLTQANMHFRHDIYKLPLEQLDVKKLRKGGARAQFFAICLPNLKTVQRMGLLYEGDWKHIRRLAGILYHTCALHPDEIAMCKSADDLARNTAEGKISAVLTIEDGRELDGDLSRLKLYHKLGVRLVTLTWNYANSLGFPNMQGTRFPTEKEMLRGLTSFGKDAVEEMNRLGILVDVSHLSDGGFWDVADVSKKPFVASHSNCRALCSHPRNLTDQMIRKLALAGGIVGLNQNPPFLRDGLAAGTIEDCVRHLRHLADVGGIDCAALGSDFDGCRRSARLSLKGPQDYPLLADRLAKNGFSQDDIEKIFYRNVERVLYETL